MHRITERKSDIAELDICKQRVNVPATSTWLNILNYEYFIVQNIVATLKYDKDGKYILRGDVMNSSTSEEMIVRTLIWAYPLGNYNIMGLRYILTNIPDVVSKLMVCRNKFFSPTDFQQKFDSLCGIKYIGQSTASVLMYFFNVHLRVNKCNLCAVAVTKPLMNATNHFDELQNIINLTYIEQIKLIHSIANEMNVEFDQIELFLRNY